MQGNSLSNGSIIGTKLMPNGSQRAHHCVSTWSCENYDGLVVVQQFTLFFLVLYFGTDEFLDF